MGKIVPQIKTVYIIMVLFNRDPFSRRLPQNRDQRFINRVGIHLVGLVTAMSDPINKSVCRSVIFFQFIRHVQALAKEIDCYFL